MKPQNGEGSGSDGLHVRNILTLNDEKNDYIMCGLGCPRYVF